MFDDGSCASFFLGVVVLLSDVLVEVSGEICKEYGQECEAPSKCCGNRCCSSDYNASMITYYRWNLWNMWYFWFIIVFILMSCFGGCGYYKRRQMLFARQRPMAVSTTLPPRVSRRGVQAPVTVAIPIYPNGYAYTGPGVDMGSYFMEPPPYSEVVSKPDLYPVNKTELPPYPGQPVIPGEAQQNAGNQFNPSAGHLPETNFNPSMPQAAPPYSEVVENNAGGAQRDVVDNSSDEPPKPAQPM